MHTYTHTGISSVYCRTGSHKSDIICVTSKTYIHSVNRLWVPSGKELTVAYVWRPARKRGPQLYNPKKLNSANKKRDLGNPVLCDSPEGCGGVGWGGREVQEGGDTCILRAESHCGMAETDRSTAVILQLNKCELGSPGLQQWAPKPPYENRV